MSTPASNTPKSAPDSLSQAATIEPSVDTPSPAAEPAMDPAVTTIQPGGGAVMSIELAWGRLRRSLLRRFRPGYVERMAATRQGTRGPLPFEPVDPRDLKYYQNQPTFWWAEPDDPHAWRSKLPFVRAGLAELILIGGGFLLLALALVWLWWPAASVPLVLAGLVVWFFRNPRRPIPGNDASVVSPADGKLVQIERIDDPELGQCVQIGIFLSIFNVHANRASLGGEVIAIRYRPGKFLNALRPESARENENLDVTVQTTQGPERKYRIRQITGQFARRIVCWAKPGDRLDRGQMYGMIKLGSRTELVLPHEPGLEIVAVIGQKVAAGSSILAQYHDKDHAPPSDRETNSEAATDRGRSTDD